MPVSTQPETHLVVDAALLRVTQHVVCLVDLQAAARKAEKHFSAQNSKHAGRPASMLGGAGTAANAMWLGMLPL